MERQWLVEGIGEYITYNEIGEPTRVLTGCIINGDTLGNITTSVDDKHLLINGFQLYQNYPNPFNPTTNIELRIQHTEFVSLKVYNLLGELAADLLNEPMQSGIHKIKFDGNGLAAGIYIYRLVVGNTSSSKKMILLK